MSSSRTETPRVFISSTHEDLRDFRQAASNGVSAAQCLAVMTEYWAAQGDKTSYEICFDKVRECDVLIVLVAHRYGWEPEYQPGPLEDRRNMVWLECQAARDDGQEVLAIVVDDEADWPPEKRDDHVLTSAIRERRATPELFAETDRKVARLADFKEWLRQEGTGIYKPFRHITEVEARVESAIRAWKDRQGIADPPDEHKRAPGVPAGYLDWVKREYGSVELLGLGSEDTHAGRLRQVYVPAVTDRSPDLIRGEARAVEHDAGERHAREREGPVLLLDRLGEDSLYVPGAPGAGKSTFCRWVAWTIANGSVPSHEIPPPDGFAESLPAALAGKLPVLVELRDFWQHMDCKPKAQKWHRHQLEQSLAAWLDATRPGDLSGAALLDRLAAGDVVLALDGVDEVETAHRTAAGTTHPRACLLSALADALEAWQEAGNRVLLTSRPYGLNDAEQRKLGLPVTSLGVLPQPLQNLFIARWYAATDTGKRDENTRGLIEHLAGREDLSELTQSPLLLTALCIRFAQGQRLPDDLFDLYDGLVSSVLFSRYGADSAERDKVRNRLAAVAHGMHTGPAARPRATPLPRVGNDEVDEHLLAFGEKNWATEDQLALPAERRNQLLSRSGLLLPAHDGKVQFYHLSFQEFLTADYLIRTSRSDERLLALIRQRGAEKAWRPTLMFVFTGMVKRDPQWSQEQLDELAGELTREQVAANPSLAAFVAQCAEVLLKKKVSLGELSSRLTRICLDAIEDEVEINDRQVLGLALGRLGDPRVAGPRDPAGFVEIPAGKYRDATGDVTSIEQSFWLGRYPVTNGQYAQFMQAGGYENQRLWSPQGAAWLAEAGVSEPGAWRDTRFSAPNQPVVGVSYWEAEAYCAWVGGRLPSDQEWGAAAGGPDGHEYPWDGEWEDGICNTHESGLDALSPVGLFPRSRQADFGLDDLAGNVFEWCSTERGSSGSRVLRGGSWGFNRGDARADHRLVDHPDLRYDDFGFRVVCVSPIR